MRFFYLSSCIWGLRVGIIFFVLFYTEIYLSNLISFINGTLSLYWIAVLTLNSFLFSSLPSSCFPPWLLSLIFTTTKYCTMGYDWEFIMTFHTPRERSWWKDERRDEGEAKEWKGGCAWKISSFPHLPSLIFFSSSPSPHLLPPSQFSQFSYSFPPSLPSLLIVSAVFQQNSQSFLIHVQLER